VCGEIDWEDRVLICFGCDITCHLECLNPRLDTMPSKTWFCRACILINSIFDVD
jgi:hypothetical protein